jgi:MYXO-CTERM domain-containing protein
MFGGAGIANATNDSASGPSSSTTTLADNNTDAEHHSDKSGLSGLVGLLGLGGLAGLRRRNDTGAHAGVTTTPATPGRGT